MLNLAVGLELPGPWELLVVDWAGCEFRALGAAKSQRYAAAGAVSLVSYEHVAEEFQFATAQEAPSRDGLARV